MDKRVQNSNKLKQSITYCLEPFEFYYKEPLIWVIFASDLIVEERNNYQALDNLLII